MVEDSELGHVIQLQGDQRKNVSGFLVANKLAKKVRSSYWVFADGGCMLVTRCTSEGFRCLQPLLAGCRHIVWMVTCRLLRSQDVVKIHGF